LNKDRILVLRRGGGVEEERRGRRVVKPGGWKRSLLVSNIKRERE